MGGAPGSNDTTAPIAFLDRDGTIIVDRHYLSDPEGVTLLPGAAEGLRQISRSGYRLVVATNQSGVGRGLFRAEAVHAVNSRLNAMLTQEDVPIMTFVACFHGAEEGCTCRKPARGMADAAIAQIGGTLKGAIVIGDKESDMGFAQAIGARGILVSSDPDNAPAFGQSTSARNLIDAASHASGFRQNKANS